MDSLQHFTFNHNSEPVYIAGPSRSNSAPQAADDDYRSYHEVDETEELIERGILYRCHNCGNVWDGDSQCTCHL